MSLRLVLAALAAGFVTACASSYSPQSLTGGYTDKELSPTLYWVSYAGNGYTTAETVQTYWLHHCAELTLAKGYDAFELADNRIELTQARPTLLVRIAQRSDPLTDYSRYNKPWLEGQIRLLKKPFRPNPGRVFDAAALKAYLDPYVSGPKCDGNVCPHVHSYLYPPGT